VMWDIEERTVKNNLLKRGGGGGEITVLVF